MTNNYTENAKEELLNTLKKFKIPVASISKAKVGFSVEWEVEFLTTSDTQELLEYLDRNYDSGYGSQELHGHIVISKELWLSRGEYDGSEWWNVHQCPEI